MYVVFNKSSREFFLEKKCKVRKKKTKNRYYHYVRSRGEILNCYINEWALLNVSADSSFACDG